VGVGDGAAYVSDSKLAAIGRTLGLLTHLHTELAVALLVAVGRVGLVELQPGIVTQPAGMSCRVADDLLGLLGGSSAGDPATARAPLNCIYLQLMMPPFLPLASAAAPLPVMAAGKQRPSAWKSGLAGSA
jgi:hypothetical protein